MLIRRIFVAGINFFHGLSKKNSSIFHSQVTPNVFIPLFVLLNVLALGTSLQATHAFKGDATYGVFFNYLLSKTIYYWYYLLLAVIVQQLSLRTPLNRSVAWRWCILHGVVLVASVLFHQVLLLGADILIWRGKVHVSYFNLLVNNIFVWLDVLVYALFVLIFYLMEYQRINHEHEIRYSQLEVQLLKSQLQELRNMMHPPFLFHALQSIADLLDKNQNEKADHILTTLSHLLRKTVYEIESDEKTLEEELSSLHDYLEIENVRFGGTLLWTENLEDGVSHAIIPNFLLQPFLEGYIEDAWCHRSSVHTIRLTGKKLSEQLSLSLKGDGASVLRNEDEQRNYDAVFSVMAERLCQLYHDKCLFQNIRHADGTISVEIRIPYQDRHVLLEQTSEVENPL